MYVVNKSVAQSFTASQLRLWTREYDISDVWWSTYNVLMSEPDRLQSKKLFSSLFFRNEVKQLERSVSRQLYGERIQGSVSRMETFNACPFSHFASHGLHLKERQFFKLEAPDIGQLFHSSLKLISDRLREQKLDWRDLTKEQCELFSYDAVRTAGTETAKGNSAQLKPALLCEGKTAKNCDTCVRHFKRACESERIRTDRA